jgi:hypothetical protein
MFPKIMELQMPEQQTELTQEVKASFLFDFEKGDFILQNGNLVKADDVTSLKIWIEKVIRTELGKFLIYEGTEYGTSIDELIGLNLPTAYIESELQREMNESLVKNSMIDSVSDIILARNTSKLTINCTVNLINSTAFEQELSFNV